MRHWDSLDYDNSGNISADFEQITRFINYAENIVGYIGFIDSSQYYIFERIGNFYQTYGNLDKALRFFEERSKLGKELYESQPNNVGFKNGLAISYVKLGFWYSEKDTKKALGYFEQAKQLFQELYENFPAYKEFKDKYNGIIAIIEQLKQ